MNATCERGRGKTRVIHVITRFDKGGSAENTFLTVRDLDKERYDVRLVIGESKESQMGEAETAAVERNLAEARERGVGITVLPALVRRIDPVMDLAALFALIRIFARVRPHIVHTHTSKAGLLARWAAFFARVPAVIHTPHGHVFWGYFGTAVTKAFVFLERLTACITDRLVMLTDQEKADHLSMRIAAPAKFAVIHSGVDFRPFEHLATPPGKIREELGIPQGSFIAGTVGRLTAIKGQRFLLEAVALLAPAVENLVCVLLGEGELREELEQTAKRLSISDRVFFAGWRADVAPVVAAFDIFVFPSVNEGMGKALVEAMALGKPIVAGAVGGVLNLVTDGENGLLVAPGNAEMLAKSIKLLYQDRDLRHALGEKGRTRSASYSSDLMVRKIEALYRESMDGSPPR